MGKFDRYLLTQLLIWFGFFSLVLVLVYWINRAVVLFDQIIANGHSAMVFLEFTALTIPNIVRIVLPISAFAAVIYGVNRLTTESELVVVQATGFSPWRLGRPVAVFGLVVAFLILLLSNFLVPLSHSVLSDKETEMQDSMTARLLQEGTFLHPVEKVTFYIGAITPNGELHNVFLSDDRVENRQASYSARRALLVSDQSGPKLLMRDGVVQVLDRETGDLSVSTFTEFVYDVRSLLEVSASDKPEPKELPTSVLLSPTPEIIEATGKTRAILQREGHNRLSQALFAFSGLLIGFSVLLLGNFSRFGIWRQIFAAIVILIVLKTLDNYTNGMMRRGNGHFLVMYLPGLFGLVIALATFWLAARPALFTRRMWSRTT